MKEIQYQQEINNTFKFPVRIMLGFTCFGVAVYLVLLYENLIPELSYERYAFIPLVFFVLFFISSFYKKFQLKVFSYLLFGFIITIFILRSVLNDSITYFYYSPISIFFSICFTFS